ncbi:MAG: hypothetical protein R2793_10160 [Flavobacteriaceae bacterium]
MGILAKIGFGTVLLAVLALCTNATQQPLVEGSASSEKMEEKILNDYNVYALELPAEMDFAGEMVPLSDPDVRERMDRELRKQFGWQFLNGLIFKWAHKYFSSLSHYLKSMVIDDFKYLAIAESGLKITVPSRRSWILAFFKRYPDGNMA